MNFLKGLYVIVIIMMTVSCTNEKSEAENAAIEASKEAIKALKLRNDAQDAYSEFNLFVQNNKKCCDDFRMVRDTSYLAKVVKGGFSSSIDLQKAEAKPDSYEGYSIQFKCYEAHCTNLVYYKNGRVNELIKVTDPSQHAFYLPFKDRNSRDIALQMLKDLPKTEGTPPNTYYALLREYPLVKTAQLTHSNDTTSNKVTYSVVNSEYSSSNKDILTTFISCSNGKTKVVTANESISFYADSNGNRHSNFNDAALASCN